MKPQRGFDCYMTIIMALRQEPMVTADVAELLGTDRVKSVQLLNELRTLRLVRRERQLVAVHGTTYRWSLGADEALSTQRGLAAKPRANAIQFSVFFKSIQQPISVVGLARVMGVRRDAANKHIARARKNHGAVPVVRYEPRFGCHPTPMYQFAPGVADVTYTPKAVAEVNREARRRRRVAQEARQRLLSRASNSSIFAIAASMAA